MWPGIHLTLAEQQLLADLLLKPEGLYEITQLKRSPKDFGFREMQREIARGEQLEALYRVAQRWLPQLDISKEGIRYYASLITYYSTFRLQQLDGRLVNAYLLCFVFYRYQRFQDNLITYFLHQVRTYLDEARQAAQQKMADYQLARNRHLQQAGQVLALFTDEAIPASTPFGEIRAQAFAMIEPEMLTIIAADLSGKTELDETALQWAFVDRKAHEFKRRLRRVIRTVPFTTTLADEPLMQALDFLRSVFQKSVALRHYVEDDLPTAFIPEAAIRYLYKRDEQGRHLLHDRYEFLFYRELRNRIEAGDIFCRASFRFRSLEDDLLSDAEWAHKATLLERSAVPILRMPIKHHLAELKQQLEALLLRVNTRIANGENDFVVVRSQNGQSRWSLKDSTGEPAVNDPFFDTLPLTDIYSVIRLVDNHTDFLQTFDHIVYRHAGRTADRMTLTAALVAWGTNLGLGRMGKISDISYSTLATISSSFLHLESLQAANDVLVNATARLPIFPLYQIDQATHSSSDGQKFETRLHTFNARYSPKYFGLQKGVVAYTLVANHIPLHALIIGANEHESHYVLDILQNNTTEVQPSIHSTDTHGANHVNFALLHLFGYHFAPRYKDLPEKIRTSLYGFQQPGQYDPSWLLRPIRKVQEPLILDEWENVQRIILSLDMKTTTQAVIVSKLSSYARTNRTKRALWEYDNIIRSLYLLNYVDSPPLRHNVHRALNRGESYHQLKRSASFANFGKLRFRSEHDQQVWNACAQLLTNCIIFYNSLLLSELLELKQRQGNITVAERLGTVSPIAWQHVNFYGRYEFKRAGRLPKLKTLVAQLAARLSDSDTAK